MSPNSRSTEDVLVVPTLLFHEVGYFQGFCGEVAPYLRTLLDPAHTLYRPRDEVEEDPSYKQLIPYCLFHCGGELFHYKRGKQQGEGRLHSLRSVGVGGHIAREDQDGGEQPYLEGMRREIDEEVRLETAYQQRCVGMINDDLTEVGRVHLGIVHLLELEEPKVQPREESIIETGFASPAVLLDQKQQFESWSQICLEHLFADRPK